MKQQTTTTEVKHTPGPWHLCGGNEKPCKCLSISADGHPIANVISGEWGDEYPSIKLEGDSLHLKAVAYTERIAYGTITEEEAIANAQLIAAAPELLEALQTVKFMFVDDKGYYPEGPIWERLETVIESAIKNATL